MILLLAALLSVVTSSHGHGYFAHPESRTSKCFEGLGFMPHLSWPADGSMIPDHACRTAFQETRSQSSFTDRMGYRFTFPGGDRHRLERGELLEDRKVCSVGGRFPAADVATNWRRIPISTGYNSHHALVHFEFCATAPHNPARWFVYHHAANSSEVGMRWSNLQFVQELGDTPLIRSSTPVANCFSHGQPHDRVYRFALDLPVARIGTYVIVWYAGPAFQEGGYVQCIDYARNVVSGQAGEEPICKQDPYAYEGETGCPNENSDPL